MSEIVDRVKRAIKAPSAPSPVQQAATGFTLPEWAPGFLFFLAVVFTLCFVARLGLDTSVRLFTAGEIATQDVAADQNLQIEDMEATNRKREQVAESQPPVFDVSPLPYEALAKTAGAVLVMFLLARVRKLKARYDEWGTRQLGRLNKPL